MTDIQSGQARPVWAENRNAWVASVAAGAVLLAIVWPVFQGEIYPNSDLGVFHLPFRVFYADAIASGTDFDWYPWSYAGFHLHGEGQLGLYHPANWLLYRWLPVDVAFTLEGARSYVLLLLGGVLYLRRTGLRLDAALLGASLFAFGGFNTFHFMHINVTGIIAHIPFLAIAVETTLRSQRPGGVALAVWCVSVLTASMLLLGHPQFAWLSLVAMGLLTLYWLARGVGRDRALWLLAAVAIGFVLAGVQLLPQFESLADSFRAEPGEEFLDQLVLRPAALIQLVSPDFYRESAGRAGGLIHKDLYLGAVAPVLFVWVAMRVRSLGRWRVPALTSLAILTLSIVMAFGLSGGLYRLQAMLPVVGLFRAPERYLLIASIASSVLAAIAFIDLARLAERGERLEWRRVVFLAVPALAAVATIAYRYHATMPMWVLLNASHPTRLALGCVPVVLASVLVIGAARGWRSAIPLLLALAIIDLGAQGLAWMRFEPPVSLDAFVASLPDPDVEPGARIAYAPQSLALRGLRLVPGYAAMEPSRKLLIYTLSPFPFRAPLPQFLTSGLRVAGVEWPTDLGLEVPLPRARLVAHSVIETNLIEQIHHIDEETIAIVESEIPLSGGPSGEVAWLHESPGHFVFETRAPGRQLLVVAESFHGGWKALVDGAPVEVIRVYGDFMGIVVEAGQRTVQLDFDPDSTRRGIWMSGAGLVLSVMLAAGVHRVGVRPPSRDPTC